MIPEYHWKGREGKLDAPARELLAEIASEIEPAGFWLRYHPDCNAMYAYICCDTLAVDTTDPGIIVTVKVIVDLMYHGSLREIGDAQVYRSEQHALDWRTALWLSLKKWEESYPFEVAVVLNNLRQLPKFSRFA
jgi:hypothetical protein